MRRNHDTAVIGVELNIANEREQTQPAGQKRGSNRDEFVHEKLVKNAKDAGSPLRNYTARTKR
jgi:hypothetical protein